MSVIQDAYSIVVSNRYDLGDKVNELEESDSETNGDIDPLEQLKQLEEQKQRDREQKKKQKVQQSSKKSNKKGVQFKENKDANVPVKKENHGKNIYCLLLGSSTVLNIMRSRKTFRV